MNAVCWLIERMATVVRAPIVYRSAIKHLNQAIGDNVATIMVFGIDGMTQSGVTIHPQQTKWQRHTQTPDIIYWRPLFPNKKKIVI